MKRKKSKVPIKERTSAQEFNDQVKQYTHEGKKRYNNPPVGLVTVETDHLNGKKNYQYDPYLDPQLQWAGKKEGISFDVDTVSLHVHERIDPLTIIETCKKKEQAAQIQLFHYFEQDARPIREAIEFYKHEQNWSNRFDCRRFFNYAMNSLAGKGRNGWKSSNDLHRPAVWYYLWVKFPAFCK